MSKELFEDYLMDAKFGIKTAGRDDQYADTHRYPYEPTEYSILDRLIESGYITDQDVLLDYGCGMGRVPIYLYERVGCPGYGIEMVEKFCERARENAAIRGCSDQVKFTCGAAEEYDISEDVTACFFFNPFDLGIMRGVMKRIIQSYHKSPRKMNLFFYYPQDEYVAFLMTVPELEFVDEIDCTDIEAVNTSRNKIMIFSLA